MSTKEDDATLTRLETRLIAKIRERPAQSSLSVPEQSGPFDQAVPLSGIALFSVESGRRALDDARRGEGPVPKHVRTVEVELLLFASYARGRSETGYRVATQAVAAFDRVRKVRSEDQAEEMDPQALAAAFDLAELALEAAASTATPLAVENPESGRSGGWRH
ncbi:hypothetical protein [Streptomyces niveus]|uniref:hypothetical protein n=1 Tax=Streptomyces niveus TaxID=193462 RepID=UPI00369FD09B